MLVNASVALSTKTATHLVGETRMCETIHSTWNLGITKAEKLLPRLYLPKPEAVRVVEWRKMLVVVVGGGKAALYVAMDA